MRLGTLPIQYKDTRGTKMVVRDYADADSRTSDQGLGGLDAAYQRATVQAL